MSGNASSESQTKDSKSTNLSKLPELTPIVDYEIQVVRRCCESSLREYLRLQGLLEAARNCPKGEEASQASGRSLDLRECLRQQSAIVLENLGPLKTEIRIFSRSLATYRMRTWIIGVSVLSAVPLTDFLKLSALPLLVDFLKTSLPSFSIARSVSTLTSNQKLKSFGVVLCSLAVLYVAQNELSLRVARTISTRLEKLYAKIEGEKETVTEKDMETIRGWRWKVLFWGT